MGRYAERILDVEDVLETLNDAEIRIHLREVLEMLGRIDRKIFLLSVSGVHNTEIAARYEITPRTVARRLSKIKAMILDVHTGGRR